MSSNSEGEQKRFRNKLKNLCFFVLGIVLLILAYFLGIKGVLISLTIIGAAIIIGWGADLLDIVLPSGVAIAIVALLQISPEFFVELATVKKAAENPEFLQNAMANLYGANKLLVGFGPPLVFFVYYFFSPYRDSNFIAFRKVKSFNIFVLVFGLLYNLILYAKGSLMYYDSFLLVAIYLFSVIYIGRREILFEASHPDANILHHSKPETGPENGKAVSPEEDEGPAEKFFLKLASPSGGEPQTARVYAIAFILLAIGGTLLITFAEPFLESLLHAAVAAGIPTFFFIGYIAPFMSEFPEKTVAIGFAMKGKEDTAMINFISSVLSQITLLTALVPIAYSYYKGTPSGIIFTAVQERELLLVIAMTAFSLMLFCDLKFTLRESLIALGLFVWQFVSPGSRDQVTLAYLVLIISYLLEMIIENRHKEVLNVVLEKPENVTPAS